MVDIDKLRQAVQDFKSSARPTDTNSSSPATVKDIRQLIQATTTVLNQFIDELDGNH